MSQVANFALNWPDLIFFWDLSPNLIQDDTKRREHMSDKDMNILSPPRSIFLQYEPSASYSISIKIFQVLYHHSEYWSNYASLDRIPDP